MQIWNKQKKEMEEKVNVKMLQLTIENKNMKWKLMEFPELKKECMDCSKPCILEGIDKV
jgi:predicted transcriptional regulator